MLISRRRLIQLAAPALILRPRDLLAQRAPVLAYPGGRPPGFDPKHIASPGTRLSTVVTRSGGFINLLNGKTGTISGAPVQVVDGSIGPALDCSNSDDGGTFPGSTVNDPELTFGAIIKPTASANATIFCNSCDAGFATGAIFAIPVLVPGIVFPGGSTFSSTTTLVTGRAYFVAASINSAIANFVTMDLMNGQATFVTSSGGTMFAAPNGTYGVFCNPVSGVHGRLFGLGSLAMTTSKFMPMPLLKQWAADPWSYWYPSR